MALERLCQDYWPPLFAFALRKGMDKPMAQDLTQAFFAHFLERGYLRAADRSRGRFRTFLLTCFQHFLIHEWEKSKAAKRGGRFVLLSWEDHAADLESRATNSVEPRPELRYDREWALIILDRALARLREDFNASGRRKQFELLGKFLHEESAPGEYTKVSAELAMSERAVKLTVHRLRRRFGRFVREEIRETVTTDADAKDEMRYLIEILSV